MAGGGGLTTLRCAAFVSRRYVPILQKCATQGCENQRYRNRGSALANKTVGLFMQPCFFPTSSPRRGIILPMCCSCSLPPFLPFFLLLDGLGLRLMVVSTVAAPAAVPSFGFPTLHLRHAAAPRRRRRRRGSPRPGPAPSLPLLPMLLLGGITTHEGPVLTVVGQVNRLGSHHLKLNYFFANYLFVPNT